MTLLFTNIVDPKNLRAAYKVLSKRYYSPESHRYYFRPGPDGEGFEQFNIELERNLVEVREKVSSQDFAFGPYFERAISKLGHKHWPVGQFNLRDRIIYRAIYQKVAPAYDHIFSDSLLSYRKKMGAWDSILRSIRMIRREEGKLWVFRTDVYQYVERLDHQILREQLHSTFSSEPDVLRLFIAFVDQPRIVEGIQRSREAGSHPGAELTTFLYNLYLNDLDHHMVRRGFRYCRYSDDVIVYCRDEEEARRAKRIASRFIGRMKLELNPKKTLIVAPRETYEFLGYTFQGLTFTISKNSVMRVKSWVRLRLRKSLYAPLRNSGLSKEEMLKTIINDFQSPENAQKLISWLGYFHLINDPSQLKAVDKMIRERIGACLTQRYSMKNYKYASSQELSELGLHSLVGLYYRINRGRPLPQDVQRKLRGRTLFSPRI